MYFPDSCVVLENVTNYRIRLVQYIPNAGQRISKILSFEVIDYGYDPATSGVASASTDMGSTIYSQALTDSAVPSNYTPGHEYPFEGNLDASAYSGTSQEALLVDIFAVEKNRHVFYHFYIEEGREIKIEASDWEEGSRYVGEERYDCLVYTGKKSRKFYYAWQHGTGG